MEFLNFTPVIMFSFLALLSTRYFPMLSPVLFLITAPVAMFTGCHWYNAFVTPEGLAIGLALIFYSYICFSFAIITLFRRATG